MGVLPQLYAVAGSDAKGGVFYGPKNFRLRGYPAEQACNKALDDSAVLERFWEVSEQLTNIKYEF